MSQVNRYCNHAPARDRRSSRQRELACAVARSPGRRYTAAMDIRPADFQDPRVQALVAAHIADMNANSPPDNNHVMAPAALREPGVSLWVAWVEGQAAAMAGLKRIDPGHAEIKSMRTEPAFRGRGLARALLEHALQYAKAQGFARVSLETGADEAYAAARALYAQAGFLPCPAFAPYTPHPTSAYMTIDLIDEMKLSIDSP